LNWNIIVENLQNTEEYKNLWQMVEKEYAEGKCFPPKEKIFRAFDLCPFQDLKVVILGQDPYHDDCQANGLAFSVSNQVKTPPSLKNIYKELQQDLGIIRNSNELEDWAMQGVLLLNSTLTVRAHQANSHQYLGWEKFSDAVIQQISDQKESVVFVLWGGFAQKKTHLIDEKKHAVISSAHPSPLSAYRGFFGSKPFSKINDFLHAKGLKTIDWQDKSGRDLFSLD
jgi:uracil-DNA glycosylase